MIFVVAPTTELNNWHHQRVRQHTLMANFQDFGESRSLGTIMPQPPDLLNFLRSGWLLGSGPPTPLAPQGAYLQLETRPMFKDPNQGADASNFHHDSSPEPLPQHDYEAVRHILFGSLIGVRNAISLLHKLNYAEPNDWSKPLPTGRPNEVMAILTRRIRVD